LFVIALLQRKTSADVFQSKKGRRDGTQVTSNKGERPRKQIRAGTRTPGARKEINQPSMLNINRTTVPTKLLGTPSPC
jgi:hypothetical protein